MKLAAAKALAGAASHSTTSLTLFMATKSKAALPICLLLLAAPLALQQIAISRAASRNEDLRGTSSNEATPPRRSSPLRIVGMEKKRITIDMLQRAMKEGERSQLKQIEFEEMLAGLDAGELASLIPQTFTLPDSRQEKTSLLRCLVAELAKSDPGLAVRLACAADPQQPISLLQRSKFGPRECRNHHTGLAANSCTGRHRGNIRPIEIHRRRPRKDADRELPPKSRRS